MAETPKWNPRPYTVKRSPLGLHVFDAENVPVANYVDETHANGIAALPDLYEALEALLTDYAQDCPDLFGGNRPRMPPASIARSQAALLKANPKRKTDAK